jgi:hypothetical protein
MNIFSLKLPERRLLIAWLAGIPLSYSVLGFLGNFYTTNIELFLLSIIFHAFISLFFYYLIGRVTRDFRSKPVEAGMSLLLFVALLIFIPAMYGMAKQFPNLFDPAAFHLEARQQLWFALGLLPAYPLFVWMLDIARKKNFKQTRFFQFVDENLNGLILSLLFFAVYLIFASIFNRPSYSRDDIFFDADGNLYRWRFATENYRDYYWRPAHPFVLIIIRPLVGVLALLFKGDWLFAAFTLNALTGALCVFLVWYFVKHATGTSHHALLISALFGASSTQLAFASIIETYIYLSAVALVFLILLLKDKPLSAMVVTGLIAFGITISNIGQTFLAHLFVKRNLKQLILYGLIAVAFVVPLSLLHNFVYPDSQPYFWDLTPLQREGHNSFPPTAQRANYLARAMALHSVVSPEPLAITDADFPFQRTWMFRASIKKEPMRIARYASPLGEGLAIVWVGMLMLGTVFFLKNIRKQDNGYFLTFIFTILFYFALHMQYGKDVFLYATNWTYAIVLFLALAWRELAEKRWFQATLLVFILLLLVNNSQMLYAMLANSAPGVITPVWR